MSELLVDDADGVRTLALNRPEAFNSLTTSLKEALLAAVREAAADGSVRAVVLTGSGRAFCGGQDLKEHVALLESGDPAPLETVERHYNPLVSAIAAMPKPVVAAVNGIAAGAGASLAFACDLRVVSEKARFVMSFANVGLTADSGASWTLPRLVGAGRAAELLLLGEPVGAEEALRIGLVNRVVPGEELAGSAHALAARLAAGPTVAYAKIKEALAAAWGTLDESLAVEARTQAEAGATEDHREGVAAFVGKREARFTGR
ncbi:enoyl-CoA hydratase/isomerase family protein [Actinosynnema pretiosum subsp. pretiosum]|uniref:Enoyl-CoA hydratase/isomerase n=2 Tax=Actinosynnema TaxID=40566 RepID=C6WKZ3_ACTMD|nr:enoyl-CoA hydratase-related protein [Actinosynnema mirum]ACU34748.1 Enoyl-CoA hydratase/isomerase [Actinosynnema mirum DSM 43827]AXX28110.1 Enoyl-CoA hydratase [Actinosynnema pretiosum subsp. pretiosum]QUF07501.1 enoyl-CoA hydratase/isomerase family protein [Actinosynnema pretiosum subsp. pretiosum]